MEDKIIMKKVELKVMFDRQEKSELAKNPKEPV
jgi:hypothetical protein